MVAMMTAAMMTASNAGAGPGAARDTVRFSGAVRRGSTFRHAMSAGLEFRLSPIAGVSNGAWEIGVWPRDSVPIDYAAVVTPPYRGVNARDIEGWHFRNQDNTGPNQGGVNAPQRERDFFFVENRADFDTCYIALERVMWSYNYTDATVDRASTLLDSLATGSGMLNLTTLALPPFRQGARAEIDSMRFNVTLVGTPVPSRRKAR